MPADILNEIVAAKKKRLAAAEKEVSLSELWKRLEQKTPPRRLWPFAPGGFALIAEVKRASPSRGKIEWALDLPGIVRGYAAGGAGAVSVLTEEDFFGGGLHDFSAVRELSALPLLRKDFMWTEYQLVESRVWGADAVLLITALLGGEKLRGLVRLARELKLEALVECHDRQEVEQALEAGARILGINNRNLRTFEVSLETTLELLPFIPSEAVVISESGISGPEDVKRLAAAGVNGALVGESCVRRAAPGDYVGELVSEGSAAYRERR
ncbi:indole-3-glycerol phosphate synthase [Peptococcaceae bacterium CEB3]|nr:indole-3-glycerol phosphate synthase [Peptococcaceae bacterium CEB3]